MHRQLGFKGKSHHVHYGVVSRLSDHKEYPKSLIPYETSGSMRSEARRVTCTVE